MKNESDILQEASRMVPLIRSITNEARDRKRTIRFIEAKIRVLTAVRGDQLARIRPLESELFLQRREIEGIHEELARLGCSMDARQPGRIVWHVAGSEVAFEDGLEQNVPQPRRGSKT